MEPKTIEHFRERLNALRRELAGEVATLSRESWSLGTDGTQDVGDDAANTYARQLLLGMGERDRQVLRQVDEALDRIEAGTFGECEECGEPIAVARLEAMPYATLCVDCKEIQETGPR